MGHLSSPRGIADKNLGFLTGAASAIILTLAMFAQRLLFDATTLPEILQAVVLTLMPGELQSFIIDTFQRAAKPMLFVILVVGQVLAGGALGIGYASLLKRVSPDSAESGRPASSHPALAGLIRWGVAYAFLVWLFSEALLLWAAASPKVGISLTPTSLIAQGSLLLSHLVYGVSLALLYRGLAEASPESRIGVLDPGRRQVMSWLVMGSAGVLLGTGLWRLISQGGSSPAILPRKDQPAPVSPAIGPEASAPAAQPAASAGHFITDGTLPESIPGMPPEVTPNGEFYQISKNFIDPTVSEATWRLKIDGLVEEPYELTYEELRKLPSVRQYNTLTCISNEIGGDLISNALWTGVPLKDLLARARLKPGVKDIVLYGADGYTDSILPEKALHPDTIVAYEMNGVPLPSGHGFCVRLIVPGLYGIKNVKWLTGVKPVGLDVEGFWQERGWTDVGVIKTSSRIDTTGQRGSLSVSQGALIGGIAFAGDRGIARVEVSTDEGMTWQEAMIKDPLSPYTWVLWGIKWLPSKAGTYMVKVRATDKSGAVQTMEQAEPFPEGASGYHQLQLRVVS